MLFGKSKVKATAVFACFAVLLGTGIAGCSRGGSGGGSGGGTLRVLGLDVDGQTDVARNQSVTVTLSGAVARGSVSVSGLQVQGGGQVVPGRIVINGSRITFFPTTFNGLDGLGIDQSVNMYNPPNNPPENALGFLPATRYVVRVLGSSNLAPTGLNGRPIVETFTGDFRTGSGFLPEVPANSPTLSTSIEFSQIPSNISCGPDALNGDPTVQCPAPAGLIPVPNFDPSNLEIRMTFSEPMNPSTFNPFSSFSLFNVTQGRQILGEVVGTGDLRTFIFRPLNTLGDEPDSPDPFVFEFQLLGDVEDLAGNSLVGNPAIDQRTGPILDPIRFRFKSVDKPGEPNFDFIIEDFSDQEFRRPLGAQGLGTTIGVWTGNGDLEGAPALFREAEVPVNPSQFLLPQPLTAEGNKVHFLIDRALVNDTGAVSIVGLSWGPQSNFVFASNYPDLKLSIGHTMRPLSGTGLATNFASNFAGFPDNPTRVYTGDYDVPNVLDAPFFPWPAFQTDFEYNGNTNVVIEVDVAAGGDTFQLFKNQSSACLPRFRIFGRPGSETATGAIGGSPCGAGENTLYQQRLRLIQKKSAGVSIDIDTLENNPDYTSSIVIFDAARVGSSFLLTFNGKPPDADGFPDNAAAVGPVDDIDFLDGLRFVNFSFELNADPFTGIVPLIDSLSFSFRTE